MRYDLRKHNVYIAIFVCLFIILIDRVTKIFILKLDEGMSIPIIENFFHISFIYNTGAGFGTFQNSAFFLTIFSIVILIGAIYYFFKTKNRLLRIMISVLIAGIVGNLTDRLLYGKVIDFIDLRIWPIFNIADMAITLGILSIIAYLWVNDRKLVNRKKLFKLSS